MLKGGSGSTVRLMSEFICDEEGREIFDFVGRFETLDADFAAVCERLGLSARLPHNNVSAHRHYSVYYSDAARVAVEEMLGADLERFGYRFERPRRLTVRRDAASPALHEPNVERDRKLRLVGE